MRRFRDHPLDVRLREMRLRPSLRFVLRDVGERLQGLRQRRHLLGLIHIEVKVFLVLDIGVVVFLVSYIRRISGVLAEPGSSAGRTPSKEATSAA